MSKKEKIIALISMILIFIVSIIIIVVFISNNKQKKEEIDIHEYRVEKESKDTNKEVIEDDKEEKSKVVELDRFWDEKKSDASRVKVEQTVDNMMKYIENNEYIRANDLGDDLFAKNNLSSEEKEKYNDFFGDVSLLVYITEMFEYDNFGAMQLVKTFRNEQAMIAGALNINPDNLPYIIKSKDSLVPDLGMGFKFHNLEVIEYSESLPFQRNLKNKDKITKANVTIGEDDLSVFFTKNTKDNFIELVGFYSETETKLNTIEKWNELREEFKNNISGKDKENIEENIIIEQEEENEGEEEDNN